MAKDWAELLPLAAAEAEPGLDGVLEALARHVRTIRTLPAGLWAPFTGDLPPECEDADLA